MSKEFYFYDSAGTRRQVREFYFYDGAGVRKKVKEGYFYDSAGVRRQFYQTGILAATMVAAANGNFVGYAALPASPTFGSCTPQMLNGTWKCMGIFSYNLTGQLEVSWSGPTDPGQSRFTTFTDGLGNVRTSASASYSWGAGNLTARWIWNTGGDYVAGNSYPVSFA
jgi:hypothetical protein